MLLDVTSTVVCSVLWQQDVGLIGAEQKEFFGDEKKTTQTYGRTSSFILVSLVYLPEKKIFARFPYLLHRCVCHVVPAYRQEIYLKFDFSFLTIFFPFSSSVFAPEPESKRLYITF
jgi:hypothetical protein